MCAYRKSTGTNMRKSNNNCLQAPGGLCILKNYCTHTDAKQLSPLPHRANRLNNPMPPFLPFSSMQLYSYVHMCMCMMTVHPCSLSHPAADENTTWYIYLVCKQMNVFVCVCELLLWAPQALPQPLSISINSLLNRFYSEFYL